MKHKAAPAPLVANQLFASALSNHQQGALAQAELLYQKLIALQPDHFDGLLLMGVLMAQKGNPAQAEPWLSRALQINPRHAYAQLNRGNVMQELGRHDEALANYDQAIALQPDLEDAHYNRGRVLHLSEYLDTALASYERALALNPGHVEAHNNRGMVLASKCEWVEAISAYDQALKLNPQYHEAWNHRGLALQATGNLKAAILSFEKAIALQETYAEAHNNLGLLLHELKQWAPALAAFQKAIQLRTDDATFHFNCGNTLMEMQRFETALAHFDHAIRLKPDYAKAYINRGMTLQALRRHDDALRSFDQATALHPNDTEAAFNKSLLQLMLKDFSAGFAGYDLRWDRPEFGSKPSQIALPLWNGERHLSRLLLWGEQGLGDEVFYSSLLSMVGPSVTLAADPRLHAVLNRSFPGIDLMDRSELHNLDLRLVHDAHAPLGSLPRILGLLPEQVAHRSKPYFKSDPLKREIFSNQVNIDGSKITCGIAWSSKNQKIGVHKSMALSQWAPVLQNTQVEFVNLQYGDVDEEIKNVQAELGRTIRQVPGLDVHRDIDGLIALIDACDVVITTSNVTAHLAGALGKTGALLVPHAQGKIWYWHLEDARSMWYPSLQMFRLGPTPNVQPIMLEINQWLLGIVQSCGLRSNQS